MPVSPVNDVDTEDFIDIEGVAVSTVLSLQVARIDGAELDTEPAP